MGIEDRSTLVFASGIGRIKEEKPKASRPQGDGVVRIMLKRLGGGKMASVVSGVPMDEDELKDLARAVLKAELEKKGYTVKLAGG